MTPILGSFFLTKKKTGRNPDPDSLWSSAIPMNSLRLTPPSTYHQIFLLYSFLLAQVSSSPSYS
ncbi:hypothetical protein HanIR_Chr16g0797701 [Helianthus annuus]|nr:hypothetical protein HanIR_Chr16g0797701 [Helianthus annuus]